MNKEILSFWIEKEEGAILRAKAQNERKSLSKYLAERLREKEKKNELLKGERKNT